jgi:hypothetical protein
MKLKSIYLISIVLILILSCFISCSLNNLIKQEDGQLQVLIHDSPFKMSGKTVNALNISVVKMEIIRSSDGAHITLLDTPKTMDILQITANNPVILSTVSLRPGLYDQLRLILSNNNTIVIDNETFPITIPSGQQSGVKIVGPFNIPSGKLFKLILDFVAEDSVIYNKGQGYKLKPVIEISDVKDVIGIFRGTVEMGLGSFESIIKLYDNGTFKAKISEYREYDISGSYFYNSFTKILKLEDLKVQKSGMPAWQLKEVAKRLPDNVEFNVIQWTPDSVLILDVAGTQRVLTRTDSFDFSSAFSSTDLIMTVKYPNTSKNGKNIVVQLKPVDDGSPIVQEVGVFTDDTSIVDFAIPDNYLFGTSTRYVVSAFLFDNFEDFNLDLNISANTIGVIMSGSYFTETTNNPWQSPKTITVIKDQLNEAEIEFSKRLNIKMTPDDFTTNSPMISWDAYPNAQNGYFALVLIKDREQEKDIVYDNDSNSIWDIVFSKRVNETQVQLLSDKYLVMPAYPDGNVDFNQVLINPGDLIRIEIYVLDSSGRLNTGEKTGAIYMDSINIIR